MIQMSIAQSKRILMVGLWGIFCVFNVQGKTVSWPMGCYGIASLGDCVKIERRKRQPQQLLLLYNPSSQETLLYQEDTEGQEPQETPWVLPSEHIGILVLGQTTLSFCCAEGGEGSSQPVPCEALLSACILGHEVERKLPAQWLGSTDSWEHLAKQLLPLNIHLLLNPSEESPVLEEIPLSGDLNLP